MSNQLAMDLSNRHTNHMVRLVHDLSEAGWIPSAFPVDARLSPNRQLIELIAPTNSIRLRFSIYKVLDRGEPHRLDERRIEITTTYISGLTRLPNWKDVVLGYDAETNAYVGLDPRRLDMGATSHNASSSVDPTALRSASDAHILVRPHETRILGLEYQAIFLPPRLAEYLFNYEAIHDGIYIGDGPFSGSGHFSPATQWCLPASSCNGDSLVITASHSTLAAKETISKLLIEACEIEESQTFQGVSPDELEAIRRKCREVGDRGEHFVYKAERRRLARANRSDLANAVDWVSRRDVGKGYDLKSYETDGTPRHIEVKSTVGLGNAFFMSRNEWQIATSLRRSYWIYRVVDALERPRIVSRIQDPLHAKELNTISILPNGWLVTIQ